MAQQAEKQVETVKMADGRNVDFSGKRRLVKETVIDGSKVGVRLDFRNGETRTFWCPDSLLLKAAGHGLEQKYGDETAGVDDTDDMVIFIDELNDRIQAGEWNTKREGGGFGGISVLMQALMEWSGKTREEVKAFLADKSNEYKRAFRLDDKLVHKGAGSNGKTMKATVEAIEAARAAKGTKVDGASVLATLA